MFNIDFIWTDLSTYNIEQTKKFYNAVFGWDFYEQSARSIETPYFIAHDGTQQFAGMYETPAFFKKINMPAFWMSHIYVEDVEAVVAAAKQHPQAKIELIGDIDEHSKFALIRDPNGAGFTVYQGENLQGKYSEGHGRLTNNVLHIGDLQLVNDFYSAVFGWSFEPIQSGYYQIRNRQNIAIGEVEILSYEITGKLQYWMPVFAIDDNYQFHKTAIANGGKFYGEFANGRLMYSDNSGGSFLVEPQ